MLAAVLRRRGVGSRAPGVSKIAVSVLLCVWIPICDLISHFDFDFDLDLMNLDLDLDLDL